MYLVGFNTALLEFFVADNSGLGSRYHCGVWNQVGLNDLEAFSNLNGSVSSEREG